jgi:Phage integrase, N-terminal SAM-like domain
MWLGTVPSIRDWRSTVMVAVAELVSGLDAELVRLGYNPSTMIWYRGSWRRLEAFFASRGVQEFSLDLAMTWVDQACGGFFDKERAGTLKATDVYLFRVAAMLDDFATHGAVLRRYSRTVDKLSDEQAEALARFQIWLRGSGCAASTVRSYATVAGEFLAFTDTRGGLTGLDARVIDAFVATLAGYQAKTVEHKLCALRSLLRFAAGESLADVAVLEAVPVAKSTRQASPSKTCPPEALQIGLVQQRGRHRPFVAKRGRTPTTADQVTSGTTRSSQAHQKRRAVPPRTVQGQSAASSARIERGSPATTRS